jgi:NAD(P)-dependent dehydrogenase (short-subunit alcohol dehydrogenase family)
MADIETIIITGGAGHLGTAVARSWVKPGAHVVLIDRDTQRLEKARADLANSAATIIAIPADASQDGALNAALAKLSPSLWSAPPSLIVAHALPGKDEKGNPPRIGALRPGPFREVVNANLHSAVFAIDAMLPFMRQAGGGRIVLVSSTAGLSASPTAALSYSRSKAGLRPQTTASASGSLTGRHRRVRPCLQAHRFKLAAIDHCPRVNSHQSLAL